MNCSIYKLRCMSSRLILFIPCSTIVNTIYHNSIFRNITTNFNTWYFLMKQILKLVVRLINKKVKIVAIRFNTCHKHFFYSSASLHKVVFVRFLFLTSITKLYMMANYHHKKYYCVLTVCTSGLNLWWTTQLRYIRITLIFMRLWMLSYLSFKLKDPYLSTSYDVFNECRIKIRSTYIDNSQAQLCLHF